MKGTGPGTYLVPSATAKEPAAPQPQAAPRRRCPLTLTNDFLKAQNQLIYVPFTVQIEPGKLATPSIAAYLRVAPKGSAPIPAPASDKASDKATDKDRKSKDAGTYPFEDVYFTDLRATAGQPLKLTRAFAVPAGDLRRLHRVARASAVRSARPMRR